MISFNKDFLLLNKDLINKNTYQYIQRIINNKKLNNKDKYEILEEILNDIKNIYKWSKIKNNFDGC